MRTATISRRTIRLLCELAVAATVASSAIAQEAPFQSRQLTPAGEYTFGIEGPAVDGQGNLYVVNFGKPGTIGKLAAGASQSELFAVLPEGSIGNAIRFDAEGRMFVADYRKHNIFAVSPDGKQVDTYFHSDDFNQPNDITIAADGTIYASDPNWKGHVGQVWRVAKSADGTVFALPESSIRAGINLLTISFTDIRTTRVDPNSTKRFCTGTAKVVFPLNAIQDADTARTAAHMDTVNAIAQAAGVQRGADSFSFPIDFDVQPTDDRKNTFAESSTIDVQTGFLAELIDSYLVKPKIENQLLATQQAQQAQAQQQQALAQQASQAALDQAGAEDKLSAQTVNATWSAIDEATRNQIIDVQRAWVRSKAATCNIQAAGASIDPTDKETARLKCDTAANQERLTWLNQYVPKP